MFSIPLSEVKENINSVVESFENITRQDIPEPMIHMILAHAVLYHLSYDANCILHTTY